MAVAKSNSSRDLLKQPCNCYTVSSLTHTILDTNQTSNLKDRYVLGEQLGWGQFGVIRMCTDRSTGEKLACKSIAKDRLVTSDDARSVRLEIEIMTRLSGHPNVVDLKAVYEDEDYVHLVMELCAGGELFHQLEKQGRFSEVEARVIFRHLMQVVFYCHEIGVVHRDLKPENILLATKASSSPIKLADFGLATYINPDHSWMKDALCPEEPSQCEKQSCEEWDLGGGSFSTLMARNQDVSFGTGSPITCDTESPTLGCRSSFSSFLVEPSTPSSVSEVSLENMLMFPQSPLFCGHESREMERKSADVKRSGGAIGSRMGMNSKRNHTIGLGECEQLNLMVTESVIRWASCTHLPTAPSLSLLLSVET
ncbi:hypothetical protein GH714_026992 [Hevea brasiliensis]|uniref:non-specific serine/threonine protein kinase n=1 Tax=Hevea brasiliensis TaxID=3981 RepID=A0A6A6MIA7_HEVBR|nr:hypothetical protein GH714_026992 [Hevea brasiliensis]